MLQTGTHERPAFGCQGHNGRNLRSDLVQRSALVSSFVQISGVELELELAGISLPSKNKNNHAKGQRRPDWGVNGQAGEGAGLTRLAIVR